MRLKNNALQELYDTLVGHTTISISPYTESPIDKAFRECDEKLQKDIDDLLIRVHHYYMNVYGNELAEQSKQIEQLEKAMDNIRAELETKVKRMDEITKERDSYHDLYTELSKEFNKLFEESKQISELRCENAAMHELIDNKNEELEATLKDYDKLSKENRGLNARTDCLRLEVTWYRKHYKEQSDKIGELKKKLEAREEELDAWTKRHLEVTTQIDELASQYQKVSIENKRLQDDIDFGSYQHGQSDLWDMLQNVNDSPFYDFDAECDSIEDVISMDLEDFLDTYKKWQEEKEKERLDHMRDYLDRFCRGRLCSECPLGSDEYKCGSGYSFTKFTDNDCWIIPDEELGKYYEKARGCGRYTLKNVTYYFDNKPVTMTEKVENLNRTISKACENFCKAVRDADIKITENLRKGCTLTANVEVNKDLLAEVCGIAPEEEEHKLEYGDAVRLPWCDYDYMYIEPDNEEGTVVRMFDPKNHAIATTHIGNVRYNGGKILVCEEDDLKKIWKDKK